MQVGVEAPMWRLVVIVVLRLCWELPEQPRTKDGRRGFCKHYCDGCWDGWLGEAEAEPAQSPESDGSVDSSPLSDLSFDVSEPQWEDASAHFNLQKFSSYEIDWDSLWTHVF